MAEDRKVDLVHLTDGENSFKVRVLGRRMPGVLPWHDFLDVEFVVASAFVHGRLEACLAPTDLDGWAQVLGALAAGRSATWMDDGHNPEIRFESSGRDGTGRDGTGSRWSSWRTWPDRGHRSVSRCAWPEHGPMSSKHGSGTSGQPGLRRSWRLPRAPTSGDMLACADRTRAVRRKRWDEWCDAVAVATAKA